MLYLPAIKSDTLDILIRLQQQVELADTRLVGGTALALQLGHRLSVDIDLFGIWDQSADITEIVGRCGSVVEEHRTNKIRVFNINDIKVDIVHYDYVWLSEPIEEKEIRLATIDDIAAMKLEAINNRGSKKDFIDLAFLLDRHSIEEILALYHAKYPRGSEYLVLRSLVYFDDAEDDPMPVMLKPMTWEAVKEKIMREVRRYGLRQ